MKFLKLKDFLNQGKPYCLYQELLPNTNDPLGQYDASQLMLGTEFKPEIGAWVNTELSIGGVFPNKNDEMFQTTYPYISDVLADAHDDKPFEITTFGRTSEDDENRVFVVWESDEINELIGLLQKAL